MKRFLSFAFSMLFTLCISSTALAAPTYATFLLLPGAPVPGELGWILDGAGTEISGAACSGGGAATHLCAWDNGAGQWVFSQSAAPTPPPEAPAETFLEAVQVGYNPSVSGLTAVNLQDAVDEVAGSAVGGGSGGSGNAPWFSARSGEDAATTDLDTTHTVVNLSLTQVIDTTGAFTISVSENEVCYTKPEARDLQFFASMSYERTSGGGTSIVHMIFGADTTGAIGDGDEFGEHFKESVTNSSEVRTGSMLATHLAFPPNECVSVLADLESGTATIQMTAFSLLITELGTNNAHAGTIDWDGTSILDHGAVHQYGLNDEATITHRYATSGDNDVVAVYSDDSLALSGDLILDGVGKTISIVPSTFAGSSLDLPEASGNGVDVFNLSVPANLTASKNCQVSAIGLIPADCLQHALQECFVVYAPVDEVQDTDDIESFWRASAALTLSEVWCETDTGIVNMDVQIDDGIPADVMGVDLVCAATAVSDSAGLFGSMSAGDRLDLAITSVAANPTRFTVCVGYDFD